MTFFPRTLLWRSVLLIALLLVIAHLAWLEIFRASEREPRARQVAQQITSAVNLTRAALITADPSKRLQLLQELSQEEGIQIYIGHPGERVAPLGDRPFLRLVEAEVKRQLGNQTQLATSRDGVRGAWVSFRIDEDDYWVFMPRSRLERADPLRWVGWGALVLALSLLGAYLIVARINRPLRELARAADEIGRGRTPPPVAESGPAEIRTLARAFNQMGTDLKRLDDERALLLAGVSHDLRTPLSRIRLGLEMMDDKGDSALKAGLVQDIGDIDAAINQFLDFARITEGETVVPDGDLNAIARELRDRYARGGKDVAARLAPLPPLALRPLAIQRLIANLVDNALRHGGGRIEVTTASEGGSAVLEVLDRGPGIPAGEVERMLQPFTRLDAARSGAGTGLGLAIVDRIARLHGGSVQLSRATAAASEPASNFRSAWEKSDSLLVTRYWSFPFFRTDSRTTKNEKRVTALGIHRPTHAVGLSLEEVTFHGGDEQRGQVRAAEAAVGRAVRRHRVRLQHPPVGENTVIIAPGPLTSQPLVATMLPSASRHMPSMPRCTPLASSPQVNSVV